MARSLGVPLGKDSVVSLAIARITDALLRKALRPGDYLPSETELAKTLGVEKARVVGHATHAGPPAKFSTAPIGAIRKLADRIGWRLDEVDLFEINEAFAVVVMAAMRDLELPHEKVNIHGGACALGHPIGASGARIIVTLLAALKRHDLKRGIAALCIGGGEATAIAVERMS